jgi:hypothetical protein
LRRFDKQPYHVGALALAILAARVICDCPTGGGNSPAWASIDVLKPGMRLDVSTAAVQSPAISVVHRIQHIDDNRLPEQRVVARNCANGRNG